MTLRVRGTSVHREGTVPPAPAARRRTRFFTDRTPARDGSPGDPHPDSDPTIINMAAGMRVAADARLVERELQTARLRAVAINRAMRVRFNCPAAGQSRLVEVIGTPTMPAPPDADSAAATRCGLASPHPDLQTDWFTAPNNDGPLNSLDRRVVFAATQTLEFWPDGTVRADAAARGRRFRRTRLWRSACRRRRAAARQRPQPSGRSR